MLIGEVGKIYESVPQVRRKEFKRNSVSLLLPGGLDPLLSRGKFSICTLLSYLSFLDDSSFSLCWTIPPKIKAGFRIPLLQHNTILDLVLLLLCSSSEPSISKVCYTWDFSFVTCRLLFNPIQSGFHGSTTNTAFIISPEIREYYHATDSLISLLQDNMYKEVQRPKRLFCLHYTNYYFSESALLEIFFPFCFERSKFLVFLLYQYPIILFHLRTVTA